MFLGFDVWFVNFVGFGLGVLLWYKPSLWKLGTLMYFGCLVWFLRLCGLCFLIWVSIY